MCVCVSKRVSERIRLRTSGYTAWPCLGTSGYLCVCLRVSAHVRVCLCLSYLCLGVSVQRACACESVCVHAYVCLCLRPCVFVCFYACSTPVRTHIVCFSYDRARMFIACAAEFRCAWLMIGRNTGNLPGSKYRIRSRGRVNGKSWVHPCSCIQAFRMSPDFSTPSTFVFSLKSMPFWAERTALSQEH